MSPDVKLGGPSVGTIDTRLPYTAYFFKGNIPGEGALLAESSREFKTFAAFCGSLPHLVNDFDVVTLTRRADNKVVLVYRKGGLR